MHLNTVAELIWYSSRCKKKTVECTAYLILAIGLMISEMLILMLVLICIKHVCNGVSTQQFIMFLLS